MNAPELWTDTYKVHSYHSDRYGKLKINVIAGFLQESAWLHSNACGIGYKDLLSIGKMWILSGIKIKINEYPSWGDEVILNTWGNEIEDPFAFRDFEIVDKSGKQVVSGSTSWLLINANNHRPNRITPEYQKIPRRGVSSGSGKPIRIGTLIGTAEEKNRVVNNSDIDIYQHVNNAKYVEWFYDLIPSQYLENQEISEITVNYLNECLPENEIRFSIFRTDELNYAFSAFNQSINREVCRAQFSFRKKTTH